MEKNEQDLNDYLVRYRQLGRDSELEHLLGIPIIFRMIVVARYLPGEGQTVTQIYDNLFEVTWERHRHREGDATVDSSAKDKAKLSNHALDIFCDNDDTAPVQGILDAPWLFSFYTTHANSDERRVGFLHRSFYQYFLAHEILSWFRGYASDCNEECFREHLALLACRRIDNTTLEYIRDLYPNLDKPDALDKSFSKAYAILKETDGILQLPLDKANVAAIKDVTPLEGANNVFWNVVSICGITGHTLSADKVNTRALQLYNLSECYLRGAHLMGANLAGAHLMGANLAGANLNESRLELAHLERADLRRANLQRANLQRANLQRADLQQADLVGALLQLANLYESHLKLVHLEWAVLSRANLEQANLMGANFERARLSVANLNEANLARAHLVGAYLFEARLERANLLGTNLERANLKGVNLREANLTGANLRGADLRGAHLEGANYSKENLDKAITDKTDV